MKETCTSSFLVLNTLKFKDHFIIVKGLTKDKGVKSFIVNRKQKIFVKYLQPLQWLEIAYVDSEEGLCKLQNIEILYHYQFEGDRFIKNTVLMFLNEVLDKTISKEAYFDEALFSFIFSQIQFLDQTLNSKYIANFSAWFLYQLTYFLGIQPNTENYSLSNCYFNLKQGTYQSNYNDTLILDKSLSLLWYKVGTSASNLSLFPEINYKERQALTAALIQYFQYHQDSIKEIKSYSILKTLFE